MLIMNEIKEELEKYEDYLKGLPFQVKKALTDEQLLFLGEFIKNRELNLCNEIVSDIKNQFINKRIWN